MITICYKFDLHVDIPFYFLFCGYLWCMGLVSETALEEPKRSALHMSSGVMIIVYLSRLEASNLVY
jgi:hypothetical protein